MYCTALVSSRRCFLPSFRSFSSSIRIVHVTDSEGTASLKHSLSLSPSSSVYYHPDRGLQFRTSHSSVRSHSGSSSNSFIHFIYGGDATDRGPNDLETLQLLVDFKQKYPNQVHLLVGNRDIKMTRLPIELHPHLIKERIKTTKSPYWIKPSSLLPIDLIKEQMIHQSIHNTTIDDYMKLLSIEQCQILYLQWMLKYTMGSPEAWNYRMKEIIHSHNSTHHQTIQHVTLQSFLSATNPIHDGIQAKYLRMGQVAVQIPHTGVLAVHGAITEQNIGLIPGVGPLNEKNENNACITPHDVIPCASPPLLTDWIKQLNLWYEKQLEHWHKDIQKHHSHPILSPIGLDSLNRAVLPVENRPKFPMTADYLTDKRGFQNIPNTVSNYLKSNGISLLLTGHQPIGDYPAVLRSDAVRLPSESPTPGLLFLNGDTSYGGFGRSDFSMTNPRGPVAHLTEIEVFKPGTMEVHVNGIISDGSTVNQTWRIENGNIVGDPFIGRVVKGHELVQCRLENANYRLAHQKEHKIHYREVDEKEVQALVMEAGGH
jgi:hypothetical protein